MRPKVLIGIPINEEKIYCLPTFLDGLRRLVTSTEADTVVAFAVNGDDGRILDGLRRFELASWLVPVPRRTVSIPADHVFTAPNGELNHMLNIALARNALREAARVVGAEYLFFLDADGCVAPDALNRLLKHNLPVVSCMFAIRLFDSAANPLPPESLTQALNGTDGPAAGILSWDDIRDQPAPVMSAGYGFGACLMAREVFERIPITFRLRGKEVEWSEDYSFHRAVFDAGFACGTDHTVPTIHFMSPQRFPYGWTHDNRVITYDDFVGSCDA